MEAGPVTPTLGWETLSPHTPAAPPDECPTRKGLSVQHYTWRQGLFRIVHGLCHPFITSFSSFVSTLYKTSSLSHGFFYHTFFQFAAVFFFNFAKKKWQIIMQLNVSISSFVTLGVSYICPLLLSRVQLFATPWTAAQQAPLFMGFSSQESGQGCHSLLQGIL